MHLCQPFSNTEDRLIGMLDSARTIAEREAEAEAIRLDMLWRERCRLVEFRRLAREARNAG